MSGHHARARPRPATVELHDLRGKEQAEAVQALAAAATADEGASLSSPLVKAASRAVAALLPSHFFQHLWHVSRDVHQRVSHL